MERTEFLLKEKRCVKGDHLNATILAAPRANSVPPLRGHVTCVPIQFTGRRCAALRFGQATRASAWHTIRSSDETSIFCLVESVVDCGVSVRFKISWELRARNE